MERPDFSEFDDLLRKLDHFASNINGGKPAGDRLGIEEIVDRVLEKCRLAMEAGNMSARDYHQLKGLVERRRQSRPAQLAKALSDGVRTGAVGLCEAHQKARMMSDGPMGQLGAWWESSYFSKA